MSKVQNLVGLRFGILTVTERASNGKHGDAMWVCRCDCGNTLTVRAGDLRCGHTKSCKCMKEVWNSEKHKSHGLSKTRLHKIWCRMIDRCYNPNHSFYHRYGQRGIRICDEWRDDFQSFYNWSMANGYFDGLTIDRIDNDGNYCPENCRWITMLEQHQNTSDVHLVTVNGRTQNVTQWCNELGLKRSTVYQRLKRGWKPERALELEN